MSRFLLLLDIALKHLSKRRRQTVVAVAGVGIGVGFFLAVSALMVGSQDDFVKTLIDAAPHITISDEIDRPTPQPAVTAYPGAAVQVHGYKPRTEARGIRGWQAILKAANAIPGAVATPSLTGAVTLRVGGREQALGIVGVDPEVYEKVIDLEDDLAFGRLRDLETTQGGLIVSEELAEKLGVGMGDIVGATSARGGARSLRIVGLIGRGQSQFGTTSGFVLLREAQSMTGQPFIINSIGIRLTDPYAAEGIADGLEGRFGYKAESWQERSADFLGLLVTRNIIMYTVVSAILLVASFGIYTVVSTAVADKRRDIAIMRSMGFSQGDLQGVFVMEGLILAVIGIVAGWALGFMMLQVLGGLEFDIRGKVQRIPIDRSATQYFIAGGASLLSAVIAAWLPARKAARVDPVDILRGAA